jgi:hypothetical protein
MSGVSSTQTGASVTDRQMSNKDSCAGSSLSQFPLTEEQEHRGNEHKASSTLCGLVNRSKS